MCGIVGYIGTQAARKIILEGLSRLEYRGYDSAGIATICEGKIDYVRAKGKLDNLQVKLGGIANAARVGIGHTRWATHGKPEEYNAHPQLDSQKKVAVVQNGIIENYRYLRENLASNGVSFASDTDTEVIPQLIARLLPQISESEPSRLLEAVRQTVNQLQGAYAITIMAADYPDELIAVRQQAPLVIGLGQGEFFCASDTTALIAHTKAFLPLANGEIARLTPLGIELYDFQGKRLYRYSQNLNWNAVSVEKQGFKHFMLKEIYEQPMVVRTCLETYLSENLVDDSPVHLGSVTKFYSDIKRIQIIACGTSWHASLVGKYLLEQLAGIPTTVLYASEFRYAPPPCLPYTLTIGVTQSGETADTLAALEMEQQRLSKQMPEFSSWLLGITNRPESSLGRLVPHLVDTKAGIEIGVAATKTFLAQLVIFYLLALDLAFRRKAITLERKEQILKGLQKLPAQIELILQSESLYIEQLGYEFSETQDSIYIGRGINFPIALEGALKLKEISYIHAEGYPGGEMKHGPIALLNAKCPVVAIAMPGCVYHKILSNAQEAKARDVRLIGITSLHNSETQEIFNTIISVPEVEELLSPLLTVVPLQLLAYYIAAHRGLDIDQPRNLAKSVTVE